MRLGYLFAFLSCVVPIVACGTSPRSGFEPAPAPAASTDPGHDTSLGPAAPKPTVDVSVSGTVYAPNGSVPMANTLVYVTATEPAAIPQGVYCDECVTLDKDTFAVSAADGTFQISAQLPTGDAWLVVQKGQFRRVRKVSIKGGELDVDKKMLTLPGKSDPSNGDDVPKMIVLKDDSDYDKIDESLNKLGITDFEIRNDRALLEDANALNQYQVVFVPCGGKADPHVTSDAAKANMQSFVSAGGKLYVTDWSYEFVRQPFPGFLGWVGESGTVGSAAGYDEWDGPATATDTGLGDWLAATGDQTFSVQGNWTKISAVGTVSGLDAKGNPTDITPKVWVSATTGGQTYPTTVSFEYQCGRVLFSSYHTENSGTSGLAAQEKALLYVLLEVGVCVGKGPGVQ